MNSRETILNATRNNQPAITPLPLVEFNKNETPDRERFKAVLNAIGGQVVPLPDEEAIRQWVAGQFNDGRKVSTLPFLNDLTEAGWQERDPHTLQDVKLAVIEARLGVTENGAVWVTEIDLQVRALPFIAENLAVVLDAAALVDTMHEAYQKIGSAEYGFGVFIAGPSKTADIEQSLVIGAHGPRSMHVLLKTGN